MHLGNFSTETNVNVKKWHAVWFYMAFYKTGQRTDGRLPEVHGKRSAPGKFALGYWDSALSCLWRWFQDLHMF